MRRSLVPILFAKPGWVLPGATLDMDFANNRAWRKGGGLILPASLLTTTRASTGYAQWSDGHLSSFAANVPRITDLGLLVEQARTNLMLQSQTLATSPWGESHAGTGTAPTVTNAFGTAPDGTTTACRVQMALNGGTTSSDRADWAQTVTVANATTYTLSFYVQSNTASTYAMQMGDSTTGTISAISVTPTAARVSMQFLTASTTATPRLRLRGGQTPANSDSVDILVWGADLEAGSFPTSYIPTTTVAVTRAADAITANGAFATAATATPISVYAKTIGLVLGAGATNWAIGLDGASVNDRITLGVTAGGLGNLSITNGGSTSPSLSTGGAISAGQTIKLAAAINTNDAAIVSNGGAPITSASVTVPVRTGAAVGNLGGGSQFLNSYLQRLAIFPARLSNAQLQALTQ